MKKKKETCQNLVCLSTPEVRLLPNRQQPRFHDR